MSPKKLSDYEANGVALLQSGAYVLSRIPDEDLVRITSNKWESTKWSGPRLITIRSSKRGAHARFGYSAESGGWLKYPSFKPLHGSVAAFHAEVEDIEKFLTRMESEGAAVWAVRKLGARNSRKDGNGFLIAPPDSAHNTLVCWDSEGIHLIPFELSPPAHAIHEFGTVTRSDETTSSLARASLKEMRRNGLPRFSDKFTNTSAHFLPN